MNIKRTIYTVLPILMIITFILSCGHRKVEQAVIEEPTQPVEEPSSIVQEILVKPTILSYYITDDASQIFSRELEYEEQDDMLIYDALVLDGVIPQDVKVNSVSIVNSDVGKTVKVDFSKEFIDYLDTLKYSEEFATVTAIANSYIDYFHADRFEFSANGKVVRSRNKKYDAYLVKFEGQENPEFGKFESEVVEPQTDEFARSIEMFSKLNGTTTNALFSPLMLKAELLNIFHGSVESNQDEIKNFLEDTNLASDNVKTFINDSSVEKVNTIIYHQYQDGETVFSDVFESEIEQLGTMLKPIDFTSSSALEDINSYVNGLAFGDEINIFANIQENDDMYVLSLTNFNGTWKNGFDNISDETFTNADGTEITMPMMHSIEELEYFENDEVKGFIKPFEGNYSFIAVLPQIVNLDYLDVDFTELLDPYNLETKILEIEIPEIVFNYTAATKSAVQDFGVSKIFNYGEADFTPMISSESGPAYVSDILQYNKLSLAMEATENNFESEENIEDRVILDQPFLFAIYDNTNNEVILIGQINNIN